MKDVITENVTNQQAYLILDGLREVRRRYAEYESECQPLIDAISTQLDLRERSGAPEVTQDLCDALGTMLSLSDRTSISDPDFRDIIRARQVIRQFLNDLGQFQNLPGGEPDCCWDHPSV